MQASTTARFQLLCHSERPKGAKNLAFRSTSRTIGERFFVAPLLTQPRCLDGRMTNSRCSTGQLHGGCIIMGRIETRLQELGFELPAPLILPSANRTSAVRVGNFLFVSGYGADLLEDKQVKNRGKVGLKCPERRAIKRPAPAQLRCWQPSSAISVIWTRLAGCQNRRLDPRAHGTQRCLRSIL